MTGPPGGDRSWSDRGRRLPRGTGAGHTRPEEQASRAGNASARTPVSRVRVSLDDFGTGFSSLNHLRAFPGASLKIDRSFIQSVEENGSDAAIVRSLIAMAHSLDLKVIAEGVERPAQLRILAEYGCDFVQGFLLGRPAPAEEITRRFLDRPPSSPLGRGRGRAMAPHGLELATRLPVPGT